ncbi:MAG: hypothetical protein EAZ57_09580 [Cytophagales bacterium]|nr:MAG: hypothetical protein EAZ67_01390 [Cytophagales bacterium]TAF59888.1 MAG: hypothetical protein EAZ57_09580 [Cytophagales bacterium]
MKSVLLSFVLLFCMAFVKPDNELVVVSVKGVVKDANSQEIIKAGDRISVKTKLQFAEKTAKIAIVEPDKTHYVIKAPTGAAGQATSLRELLGTCKTTVANTGSRDITANVLCNTCNVATRDFKELGIFFARSVSPDKPNPLEIIGIGKYKMNLNTLTLNDKNYFAITYLHNGNEVIQKLRHEGDFVFIDESVFMYKGQAVTDPKDIKLHYLTEVDVNPSPQTYICHIRPQIVANAVVREEITNIIKLLPSKKPQEVFEKHIVPYLIDFYSRLTDEQIVSFLPEDFKKSIDI